MGIDHTAIVVSNTEASLKFYRDILGFQVAGESENYGIEQEHLNNVFGARLHITSMKPPSGPSVEFLEYLAPHDGRPYPSDERTNDVINWQTRLFTNNVEATAGALVNCLFVSPGVVVLENSQLGFKRGFLVRDPDGHVMEIAARN